MIKPSVKGEDGLKYSPTDTENRYIITEYKGKKIGCFFAGGVLTRIFASFESGICKDTVLVARVSEVQNSIDSSFLLVSPKEKCYLPNKLYSPEMNLTAERDIKGNDLLLVKITKNAAKGKLPGATCLDEELISYKDIAKNRTAYTVLKKGFDDVYSFAFANGEGVRIDRIITDNEFFCREIKEIMKDRDDLSDMDVVLYDDNLVSLKVLYGIEKAIKDSTDKKIWLKSGGFIYIEQTEAMTVIDVNSGKYDRKTAARETFINVNIEAFEEIVHQIILRNLSGIIIIDQIKSDNKEDRDFLLSKYRNIASENDRNIKIAGFSKLGLLEMTRKKTGKTIYEQFLPYLGKNT